MHCSSAALRKDGGCAGAACGLCWLGVLYLSLLFMLFFSCLSLGFSCTFVALVLALVQIFGYVLVGAPVVCSCCCQHFLTCKPA